MFHVHVFIHKHAWLYIFFTGWFSRTISLLLCSWNRSIYFNVFLFLFSPLALVSLFSFICFFFWSLLLYIFYFSFVFFLYYLFFSTSELTFKLISSIYIFFKFYKYSGYQNAMRCTSYTISNHALLDGYFFSVNILLLTN